MRVFVQGCFEVFIIPSLEGIFSKYLTRILYNPEHIHPQTWHYNAEMKCLFNIDALHLVLNTSSDCAISTMCKLLLKCQIVCLTVNWRSPWKLTWLFHEYTKTGNLVPCAFGLHMAITFCLLWNFLRWTNILIVLMLYYQYITSL
jgi:hypothetical protein